MRHRVYGKHLGRTKNQRTALFKSLVQALILSQSIETTESKAKAIKGMVDKVINQAKSPTTQRLVSQFLIQKKTQDKLFKEILPRLKTRGSGYTTVVRLGKRLGDGTMMVKMSLLLEESKKAEVKASPKAEVVEEKPVTKKAAPKKTIKKETK